MRYTYSDWVRDHSRTIEKIETVITEQAPIAEEKFTEPEEIITVAASTEDAIETVIIEQAPIIEEKFTEPEETVTVDASTEGTTTYKYRGGYSSKKK